MSDGTWPSGIKALLRRSLDLGTNVNSKLLFLAFLCLPVYKQIPTRSVELCSGFKQLTFGPDCLESKLLLRPLVLPPMIVEPSSTPPFPLSSSNSHTEVFPAEYHKWSQPPLTPSPTSWPHLPLRLLGHEVCRDKRPGVLDEGQGCTLYRWGEVLLVVGG